MSENSTLRKKTMGNKNENRKQYLVVKSKWELKEALCAKRYEEDRKTAETYQKSNERNKEKRKTET